MSEHSDTKPRAVGSFVDAMTPEMATVARGLLGAIASDMRRLGEKALTADQLDRLAQVVGAAGGAQ